MSKDFEYKMERSDGGVVEVRVTDGAVSLTFPAPVTENEKEALQGLKALAEALKREVEMKKNL
jgi:hypothetical protein